MDIGRFNALRDARVTVLDVRSEEEFAEGHIEGATHIHFKDLKKRRAELPADKAAPLVVYCTAGVRSRWAERTLKGLGYTQVYEYGGGTREWTRVGRPLVP